MTHHCSFTGCKAIGAPEAMFNIALGETKGKLVVLCNMHASEARRQKVRAFRLSDTFARQEARKKEREEARKFFTPFKQALSGFSPNGAKEKSHAKKKATLSLSKGRLSTKVFKTN